MSDVRGKRFADTTAKAARGTAEKSSAASEEVIRRAKEAYLAAAEGVHAFNNRMIEMAHSNTVAALDFAREISTAKGPSEIAALRSSYASRQFVTLTEQSKELTALAQRIACRAPSR